MNPHHQAALITIAAATVLDTGLGAAFGAADHTGLWNGLWFATVTATTVGYGDITPHGWLPHLLAMLIMLTVVPLFAATFSLFTSGLSGTHISQLSTGLHERLEQLEAAAGRLEQHLEDFRG